MRVVWCETLKMTVLKLNMSNSNTIAIKAESLKILGLECVCVCVDKTHTEIAGVKGKLLIAICHELL